MEQSSSIDPIDAYVGEQLRLARVRLELSQSYLGSCFGITFQQIQKYETGKNRISASRLARFARQLGVPISYFYQGMPSSYLQAGEPIAPDQLFSIPVSLLAKPETSELIKLYYAIEDHKHRNTVRDVLRAMNREQHSVRY